MIGQQQFGLPLRALADREALFLFPGFPPGPLCAVAAERCLLYVHDTFLLDRPEDLSLKSRLYMSPSFARALRWCPNLFVNSRTTGQAVRAVCAPRARVALLRPSVRDAFGLGDLPGPAPFAPGAPLRLLAIGTIEPRKDYPASLSLVATSKAEGLGLPLLEVQHGGLPVVAPDAPVFREVLGESALLISPGAPESAASALVSWIAQAGLTRAAAASRRNVADWNAAASGDSERFHCFLAGDVDAYAAPGATVRA
jgi:hypothetical protein